MITNVDEWQRLYEVIAADLQTSECKNVLVFVSGADVDAVAAARTLKVRTCCQPDLLRPQQLVLAPLGWLCHWRAAPVQG